MNKLTIIIILFTIFSFVSCRTQYVTVPEYHNIEVTKHDTLVVRDSIMEKDSIYIHQKNDTILKETFTIKYRDRWRDKIVYRDSIKVDSIKVPYPVEKQLTFMQRTWIKIGKTLSGIFVLTIIALLLLYIVKMKF